MNTLSILLFVVAVATIVMACAVIFSRRRKAQSAADKALRKAAEEEQRNEAEQEAVRRAEEEERQRVEAERRRLEEELRRAKEEHHKAEEERKRLDEEARREIEEVQQKAEAQRQTEELRKAEEEQRRREADEAQRKAEDETRGRAEEEARQRAKEDKERRQIPLNHRPPRRQPRPKEPSGKRSPQETKQRHPKPEIVCWKRERQWVPAVEVPEEFLENPALTALQNGSPLLQDESRENCFRLEQASGEVVVGWNEGEDIQETKIVLGQEGYLLFKLSGQNQNQGRRVKFPSSGSYLLVVPENWERDAAVSGLPPVAPESVSLTGYQAHFFILEKDDDGKIAFRISAGQPVVVEPIASRFDLVGARLNDASEDMGPLFGEKPPQIRAVDDQVWRDVGTIVVGEEGLGKGRWRSAFSPMEGLIAQDLPAEIAARKSGWYFLRFYDTNDDLSESLDFRFICALKEIRMLQPCHLPSGDGHKLASVEFIHESSCVIQGADGLARSIQIERQADKTILTVHPDPACDETRWLVGPEGGPQVEVTILVERLWWAVREENKAPSEWEDRHLTLPRDYFAATSKKALWLRLPRRRWVDKVLVGFEQPKARLYGLKVTEKTIAVPLREFGDSKEVGDLTKEHSLKVWLERDNGRGEAVVAGIPAKKPIKVPVEKKPLLNLDMMPASRLASMLTRLRRETVGPLRMLIKEVRQKYFGGGSTHQSESAEFITYALCMIALTLELRPNIQGPKKRWVVRANFARDEFPEVVNCLRNRYSEIGTGRTD